RDQILDIGLNALVGGCLRIRDVAGYVLHGEGLRLQATDRSCKSVEQTHDFISANETHFALSGLRTGCPVAITVPSNLYNNINSLKGNGGQPGPQSAVLSAVKGQILPVLRQRAGLRSKLQRHTVHAIAQ